METYNLPLTYSICRTDKRSPAHQTQFIYGCCVDPFRGGFVINTMRLTAETKPRCPPSVSYVSTCLNPVWEFNYLYAQNSISTKKVSVFKALLSKQKLMHCTDSERFIGNDVRCIAGLIRCDFCSF